MSNFPHPSRLTHFSGLLTPVSDLTPSTSLHGLFRSNSDLFSSFSDRLLARCSHSRLNLEPTPLMERSLSQSTIGTPIDPGPDTMPMQPLLATTDPPPSAPSAIIPSSHSFSRYYGYGLANAATAVAFATGNPTGAYVEVPNVGGNNWNLDLIQVPEAWSQGYTGQNIVVAVVDTGVDYTHPKLDANLWINASEIPGDGIDNDRNGFIDDIRGWDFVNWDNDPMDDGGHGTHVAGTIAAERDPVDNQYGSDLIGVAYNAKIMPVKVLGPDGGSSIDVANGIRYAANNGANVINLSLGGSSSRVVTDAIRYAVEVKGVTVVMAAGNEASTQPAAPANLANLVGIAVGAVDRSNRIPYFSNWAGSQTLDYVVAPGFGILSTTPNNTYSSFSGTSMATPHVSGVAALILSANPGLSPAQVERLITNTANPQGIQA